MKALVDWNGQQLIVDFSRPKSLSIPLDPEAEHPKFFSEQPATARPLSRGEFVGDMTRGASCNAHVIEFSPHSHGTHTECIGHVRPERDAVTERIDQRPSLMRLMTVQPENRDGRREVPRAALDAIAGFDGTALALRTLPNAESKQWRDYDHDPDFPVPTANAMAFLCGLPLAHLLLDVPSLDRPESKGLGNHAAWWGLRDDVPCGVDHPEARSLTEMIYVPDEIPDGDYWLHLELAHFICDAVPSRPVIFPVQRGGGSSS